MSIVTSDGFLVLASFVFGYLFGFLNDARAWGLFESRKLGARTILVSAVCGATSAVLTGPVSSVASHASLVLVFLALGIYLGRKTVSRFTIGF